MNNLVDFNNIDKFNIFINNIKKKINDKNLSQTKLNTINKLLEEYNKKYNILIEKYNDDFYKKYYNEKSINTLLNSNIEEVLVDLEKSVDNIIEPEYEDEDEDDNKYKRQVYIIDVENENIVPAVADDEEDEEDEKNEKDEKDEEYKKKQTYINKIYSDIETIINEIKYDNSTNEEKYNSTKNKYVDIITIYDNFIKEIKNNDYNDFKDDINKIIFNTIEISLTVNNVFLLYIKKFELKSDDINEIIKIINIIITNINNFLNEIIYEDEDEDKNEYKVEVNEIKVEVNEIKVEVNKIKNKVNEIEKQFKIDSQEIEKNIVNIDELNKLKKEINDYFDNYQNNINDFNKKAEKIKSEIITLIIKKNQNQIDKDVFVEIIGDIKKYSQDIDNFINTKKEEFKKINEKIEEIEKFKKKFIKINEENKNLFKLKNITDKISVIDTYLNIKNEIKDIETKKDNKFTEIKEKFNNFYSNFIKKFNIEQINKEEESKIPIINIDLDLEELHKNLFGIRGDIEIYIPNFIEKKEYKSLFELNNKIIISYKKNLEKYNDIYKKLNDEKFNVEYKDKLNEKLNEIKDLNSNITKYINNITEQEKNIIEEHNKILENKNKNYFGFGEDINKDDVKKFIELCLKNIKNNKLILTELKSDKKIPEDRYNKVRIFYEILLHTFNNTKYDGKKREIKIRNKIINKLKEKFIKIQVNENNENKENNEIVVTVDNLQLIRKFVYTIFKNYYDGDKLDDIDFIYNKPVKEINSRFSSISGQGEKYIGGNELLGLSLIFPKLFFIVLIVCLLILIFYLVIDIYNTCNIYNKEKIENYQNKLSDGEKIKLLL